MSPKFRLVSAFAAGALLAGFASAGAAGSISSLFADAGGGVYKLLGSSIKDGTVGTAQITDGSVASADLAPNSVTSVQIATGAVTADKISSVSYAQVTGAPVSRLSWSGGLSRIGVDGGGNNAAVAYADTAWSVDAANRTPLYLLPDGTMMTGATKTFTVSQSRDEGSFDCSPGPSTPAGWTKDHYNVRAWWSYETVADPAPQFGSYAYSCAAWVRTTVCHGRDPNWPSCRCASGGVHGSSTRTCSATVPGILVGYAVKS